MVLIFNSTQFHCNVHISKCQPTEGTAIAPTYLVSVGRCVWFVQVLVICFSFLFILGLTWAWFLHKDFFPHVNFWVPVLLIPLGALSSYCRVIEFVTSEFEGICTLEDSLAPLSFLVCLWVPALLPWQARFVWQIHNLCPCPACNQEKKHTLKTKGNIIISICTKFQELPLHLHTCDDNQPKLLTEFLFIIHFYRMEMRLILEKTFWMKCYMLKGDVTDVSWFWGPTLSPCAGRAMECRTRAISLLFLCR